MKIISSYFLPGSPIIEFLAVSSPMHINASGSRRDSQNSAKLEYPGKCSEKNKC
jgi:hypothetical protein